MGLIPAEAKGTITKRFSAVNNTSGQAISFAKYSVKGVLIHIEGSTVVAKITGTTSDTGSGTAYITSDGTTLSLEGQWDPGATILTIVAPTGTIAVSVIAWR